MIYRCKCLGLEAKTGSHSPVIACKVLCTAHCASHPLQLAHIPSAVLLCVGSQSAEEEKTLATRCANFITGGTTAPSLREVKLHHWYHCTTGKFLAAYVFSLALFLCCCIFSLALFLCCCIRILFGTSFVLLHFLGWTDTVAFPGLDRLVLFDII